MKLHIKFTSIPIITAAIILGAGCSSDDSNSSGGSAAVPPNAIVIDSSSTAETTALSAAATGTVVVSAFGIEASTSITARDVINLATDLLHKDHISTSFVNGVAFNEPCSGGGSISGDETSTSTTYNATANFNACIEGALTLNGSFSISKVFSLSTGPYTDNASGNLTVTSGSNSFGFTGLNYSESGDTSTGNYTISAFTYAINPSAGGGYAVQLTQPFIGNTTPSCQLNSGQMLISGANNSQARATINADGSVKIEYHAGDGNFIETANSPLTCLI